jgi:glyoxylase-like metal-dependent hydrolase (beta-lactamase superfamily II)
MGLPLEDAFNDIVGKAQSGLGMTDGVLEEKTGLPRQRIAAVRKGEYDREVLAKIALPLGLDSARLLAIADGEWVPSEVEMSGLKQFASPFYEMTVNAYLVWNPARSEGVIFDTGTDARELLAFIDREGIRVQAILLTHAHRDHVAALQEIRQATGKPPAYLCEKESEPGADSFEAGKTFSFAGFEFESRLTWGHSPGGTTYVITGLDRPVAITGDALFAGSIGGPRLSHSDALRTIREEIFPLPDETVICPGHGPTSTLAAEKAHNPFFGDLG